MNHLLKENRLKQEEVDAACIAIMQRGERISTNTVHKEVGERGSFSTIQKMIKDWQARNPEQSEQVEKLPLVVEIPEALKTAGNNALKAFWQQAREIAQNELKTQQEALKRAESDVNLKITELQEFSDNQANTIEVLREQLAQVTAESLETGKLFTTEKATTAGLTEKLNQALHDLELSRIENQTLSQRLTEEKAQHEKDAIELKTAVVQRDAERDKLRAELESRIKTSEERAKSLDMQVTKLQTALDIQAQQITESKTERAEALTAEKVAIEKAAALSGQLELILEDNKKLQVTIKQLEKREPEETATAPKPRKKLSTAKTLQND
jgi:DNA repair exonuclease SbcCD ATPase subunit